MSIRKIKYKGKTQSVKQWSIELNIPTRTIYERIQLCWPSELILSKDKFNYCYDLKSARRVEQRAGYPTDLHESKLCDSTNTTCCTHNSICHWAIPITPWDEISNDPSEADYYCRFMSTFVWGEDPQC